MTNIKAGQVTVPMSDTKKSKRDQMGLGDALFGTRLDEARSGRQKPKSGADLFIVDNSDADWKVKQYLSEWCDISQSFDIATGERYLCGKSCQRF